MCDFVLLLVSDLAFYAIYFVDSGSLLTGKNLQEFTKVFENANKIYEKDTLFKTTNTFFGLRVAFKCAGSVYKKILRKDIRKFLSCVTVTCEMFLRFVIALQEILKISGTAPFVKNNSPSWISDLPNW